MPELVEQLVGLAAARNLPHRQPLDDEARGRDRLADRVAEAARRVVILDGDDLPPVAFARLAQASPRRSAARE